MSIKVLKKWKPIIDDKYYNSMILSIFKISVSWLQALVYPLTFIIIKMFFY